MANNDTVPDDHDLIRYIKRRFLAKNDDGSIVVDNSGKPTMVFPQAFELREDEEYLSLTSIQLHDLDRAIGLVAGVHAIQESTVSKKLSRTSAVSIGLNRSMKSACKEHGHNVRVLEHPEDENIGHVGVRRYPRDEIELFEVLSEDVFSDRHLIEDLI